MKTTLNQHNKRVRLARITRTIMKISPKRKVNHVLFLTKKELKTLSLLLIMELMEENIKKQSIIGKDRRCLAIIYELTKK